MGGNLFALIISIGIPVGFLIYAVIRKQLRAFLLGVLAFVGSQVLFRIPILQLLGEHSVTYSMFQAMQPLLFTIVLALSAGIVEESARYIFMRYLLREQSWQSGLLFGAGHGGIEAILFVGISAIVASFSTRDAMYNTEFFIGGIERLFAILFHIGLSLLVLRSVREGRFSLLVVAILLHGFVNSLIGIIPLIFATTHSLFVIELSLAITATSLFIYNLYIKRKGVFL